jgi:hypothetical protein
MIVVTVSAVVYLCLSLTVALFWKSTNRLMETRALKDQIQKSVNAARISGRRD